MKILFFHRWTGVHFGGTETHVTQLMERLSLRGHQVSLLTRQGQRIGSFDPSIKVYPLSKNFLESDHSYETPILLYGHTILYMFKSLFYLLYLRIYLKQKFEVISVHFATEALVCRLYRCFFGTPFIFILEGYTPLEGRLAKTANFSIAISKQIIVSTISRDGFEPLFIPLGVNERFSLGADGSDFRRRYLDGGEKLIITVGRVEPRKDYPTLIEAAQMVSQKGRNYRWLIIGDGIDFNKIRDLIQKERLENIVLMLGAVSDGDLPKLYRAADLFVLPTLYEGFGIVFLEAMACGLPVVSTKVGAVPEVVGKAGLLVEPKNPKNLAETIMKIFNDTNLYDQLRTAAIEIVRNYDWDELIVKYEDAYRSVIKNES